MVGAIAGGAISKVGGIVGGTGKILGSFFALFFLRWRLFITVIIVIIHLSGAIGDAFEENSIAPIVIQIGGRILSGDETQFWKIKEIEANGWRFPSKLVDPTSETDEEEGFWSNIFKDIKSVWVKISFALNFFANLWYVYILWYVLYLVIGLANTSGKAFSAIIAIILVIGLQSTYGVSMLYINYEGNELSETDKYKTVGLALAPLKGTFYTIKHLFFTQELLEAFKESAVVPIEDIPFVNETINSSSF